MASLYTRSALLACAVLLAACSTSPDRRIASRLGIKLEEVRRLQQRRSLTDDALLRMEPEDVADLRREVRLRDLPQRRAAFLQLQLRAGAERPSRGRLLAAARLLTPLRENPIIARRRGGAMAAMLPRILPGPGGAAPDRSSWFSLGPSNIGGRTRAILVDPTHPDRVWAASVGGGIWRSDDAGMTFAPVDDYMDTLAICCLAADPHNPDTIYAGTGEGFYSVDAIRGAGIFVFSPQTNGQWKQLAGTEIPQMEFLTRLAISPDGKVLLASGGANGQTGVGGIFRSEDSAHTVWQQTQMQEMGCVQFHPTDSQKAIAGGNSGVGEAWWSEDGGKTWHQATHSGSWVIDPGAASDQPGSAKGRVELTYALKNPAIVYALVDTSGGQIWKSTDGGKSYSLVPTSKGDAAILGDQGWYDNVIWAGDPGNENFLLLGGINLWRSFDGGLNLIDISNWQDPQSIHADHHVIVAHPNFATNRTVYFGNDGGIYKAADATTAGDDKYREHGWASLNETYGTTQFYGVAASPVSGMIVAGAQDNGTLQLVKGAGPCAWHTMNGGDGGHCIAHPGDRNFFYGEYVYLDLIRSRDGGYTAEDISGLTWDDQGNPVCKTPQYSLPDACPPNPKANFYAPFALDMRNPKRLLAGGSSLWVTENADAAVTDSTGPSWRELRAPIRSPDGGDNLISAISIHPSDSNVVWIGYNDGRVFHTKNASAKKPDWTEVTEPLLPKGRMLTSIVFDSADPQVVYVTFAGIATNNVWKSIDGGKKWTPLWHGSSGDLPEMPVFSLTMHPNNHQALYMGTELGLFWSTDGGQHWSARGDGPSNCSVQDMTWHGQTLIVATHGRGIFQIDLTLPGT